MNRKRALSMTGLAAILALSGLAPSRSSSQGNLREVRRAIEAGNATWERAFRSLDAAAVASTFDEEGVNTGADGACMKGRAAVEEVMRSYFERSGPATRTRVEIGDIVLDGDLAYEWGHSEFHFAPKPGGPTERAGRYLAIWKRQRDGGWKILRNLGLPERP
ncbi:MAG TPA: SgcJ/EcaC family oxidoreductase [Thermoanaerobaculia bacterium]|nr:SgcJ/EcaC family oxidoreductase [Thermoanaerobaculia bacterium]